MLASQLAVGSLQGNVVSGIQPRESINQGIMNEDLWEREKRDDSSLRLLEDNKTEGRSC